MATKASGNGHSDPRQLALAPEVIADLEAEGIVVRDLRTGLLDFSAQAPDGRGYWLCWVPGEPEVAWWHWPDDGFAGRRPLSDPPDFPDPPAPPV